MFHFPNAQIKWWQKPLVSYSGKPYPAELAILKESLKQGENGVWLNSRSKSTGVIDLIQSTDGKFQTVRIKLPSYVQKCLSNFYAQPEIAKGVYDLIIWNPITEEIRFIEVKCPHWDKLTNEQKYFSETAQKEGIPTEIAEWEFVDM